MKRYKRVAVLLAVLALACAATFAVSRYEQHKEQIAESGETVLAIDPDAVTALSWTVGDESLAFHKDESWLYDADEAFPADADKIGERLELFSDFAAAFVIEDVEDYAQYGLDDPAATITLTAGEQNYTIKLGDFSQMDEQRYVDTGDGNVYLAVTDPMDLFDVELGELIQNDVIPDFDAVSRIAFAGAENYTVTYEEDSGRSYAAEDVYFDENGRPLDTARVEAYLSALSGADGLCDLQRQRRGAGSDGHERPRADRDGGLHGRGRRRDRGQLHRFHCPRARRPRHAGHRRAGR